MTRLRLPGRRAQTALDLLLILWAALWIALGVRVAHEVRGLAELSTTVGSVGRAVTSVADTLRGIPLIGDQIAGPLRTCVTPARTRWRRRGPRAPTRARSAS